MFIHTWMWTRPLAPLWTVETGVCNQPSVSKKHFAYKPNSRSDHHDLLCLVSGVQRENGSRSWKSSTWPTNNTFIMTHHKTPHISVLHPKAKHPNAVYIHEDELMCCLLTFGQEGTHSWKPGDSLLPPNKQPRTQRRPDQRNAQLDQCATTVLKYILTPQILKC